jgi:hypothetical protein
VPLEIHQITTDRGRDRRDNRPRKRDVETFVAAIHEFRSSRHAVGQAAALLTTQTLPITTNELDVVVSLLVGSDAVPLARACLEYLWAPTTDY